jgi:hypothetical protein
VTAVWLGVALACYLAGIRPAKEWMLQPPHGGVPAEDVPKVATLLAVTWPIWAAGAVVAVPAVMLLRLIARRAK